MFKTRTDTFVYGFISNTKVIFGLTRYGLCESSKYTVELSYQPRRPGRSIVPVARRGVTLRLGSFVFRARMGPRIPQSSLERLRG